jgi:hypothetical protein
MGKRGVSTIALFAAPTLEGWAGSPRTFPRPHDAAFSALRAGAPCDIKHPTDARRVRGDGKETL